MPIPEGVRIKLGRARQHYASLKRSVERAEQRTRDFVYGKLEPHADEPRNVDVTIYVKPMTGLKLSLWSVLTDEIAHHLRSVLDLMVYDLAITPSRPDPSGTEFPIYLYPASSLGVQPSQRYREKGIAHLSPTQQAYIESLQPYKTGGEANTLWLLHQINRRNKHRRLQFTNELVGFHGLDAFQFRDVHPARLGLGGSWDEAEGATQVASALVQIIGPNPEVIMSPYLTLEIHLSEGLVTSYKPGLKHELGRMVDQVTDIVNTLPLK